MPSTFRHCFALLAAALLLSPTSFAFDTPLSDTAVREAYFLGQRHDGSFESLLAKYVKYLPPPKTGPHISSIAFHTPFVQMVQHFSRQSNYSAQQAALDYRSRGQEVVKIFVEIRLTESYGRFIAATNPRSHAPAALVPRPRPHDFWKDFKVQVYGGEDALSPSALRGHANSSCGRGGSPCILTGATLELEFPAAAFASESVTIQVAPPESDLVSVDFDLSTLR